MAADRRDWRAARALPGVRAVVTGDDCDVPYGVIPIAQNEFPLARERVRYRGEPVAAVAAVDEATARAALGLIVLHLEPLPAVFDARAALAPDAIQLHANKPRNVEREVDHTFGDVEAGFAAAALVREASFHYAEVTHAMMEPNAALASVQPLQRATGAAHVAVWCTADGDIALAREDVGRHNALDKLIGALIRARIDRTAGFALVTSRASVEMVQKSAAAGIAVLAAVSAPTALAVRVAESCGQTLIGFVRGASFCVYTRPDRVSAG